MDWGQVALMFAGGFLTGGISAVAGGASFLTFPMFLAAGLTPLVANISNWVALSPGNFAALAAYRDELGRLRGTVGAHVMVAIAGSTLGSLLLLWSGEARFETAVPWLMLTATVFFAFGGWMKSRIAALRRSAEPPPAGWLLGFEFVLMLYAGYFGAGAGIVLLAALAIAGQQSIHMANAQKNLMIAVMSVPSVVIYVMSGRIHWPLTVPMLVGTGLGAYLLVRWMKQVPERVLRIAILAWAILLTGYSFWKYG